MTGTIILTVLDDRREASFPSPIPRYSLMIQSDYDIRVNDPGNLITVLLVVLRPLAVSARYDRSSSGRRSPLPIPPPRSARLRDTR